MIEKREDPKPREENGSKFKPQIEKQPFKSNFKSWIRIVAFVVAAIFIPEQVAQAVEYDWRVLWQRPAISNKPINAIQISPTLTVELEKPLNISKARIEEIYQWLQGKPCGAKALYDFLTYKGIAVNEQDIAVLALTIDILNEVVKPEGNPEVIKNSLYALSRASEFFGEKLYAVKINQGQTPAGSVPVALTGTVPFIAHLKGDHYILVTKITEDKVYFVDEHREEFLPREKFLSEFSGYALIKQGQSPAGTVPVSDQEAKTILGAKSRRERGLDAFG